MGGVYASLDRDDDVLSVGLNRAVDLLARKLASVRNLGPHPKDSAPITVRKGRFGPYVQHGQMVANLPRGMALEEVTAEQAIALLAEKGKVLRPRGKAAAKANGKGAAEARAKAAKPAAPKAAAKSAKMPARKPAAAKAKPGTRPAKAKAVPAAKPRKAAP